MDQNNQNLSNFETDAENSSGWIPLPENSQIKLNKQPEQFNQENHQTTTSLPSNNDANLTNDPESAPGEIISGILLGILITSLLFMLSIAFLLGMSQAWLIISWGTKMLLAKILPTMLISLSAFMIILILPLAIILEIGKIGKWMELKGVPKEFAFAMPILASLFGISLGLFGQTKGEQPVWLWTTVLTGLPLVTILSYPSWQSARKLVKYRQSQINRIKP